jgi:hypothetical protein
VWQVAVPLAAPIWRHRCRGSAAYMWPSLWFPARHRRSIDRSAQRKMRSGQKRSHDCRI